MVLHRVCLSQRTELDAVTVLPENHNMPQSVTVTNWQVLYTTGPRTDNHDHNDVKYCKHLHRSFSQNTIRKHCCPWLLTAQWLGLTHFRTMVIEGLNAMMDWPSVSCKVTWTLKWEVVRHEAIESFILTIQNLYKQLFTITEFVSINSSKWHKNDKLQEYPATTHLT
jgi:hypothetical protein